MGPSDRAAVGRRRPPDLQFRRERRSRGPVGREFLAYVLEQLATIESLRARRMFSGAGLYSDDTFFGLVADDVLYFKVDDSNRRDYEARGMAPVRRARRGSGRRPVRRSRVGTSG